MMNDAQDRLIEAILAGDLAGLKDAVIDGADPGDASVLRLAIDSGHPACLVELIAHSDSIKNHSEALQWAAELGSLDCVRALIPVSDPKSSGSAALFWAAAFGHIDCVRELIPVSDPMSDDSAALARAARNGHLDCVKALLRVSNPKANHSKALRWAAENGRIECVGELLPHCDPEARETPGGTAAEVASANGYLEVAFHIEAYQLSMKEYQDLEEGLAPMRTRTARSRGL